METRTRGAFKAWKGPLAATLILVMLITNNPTIWGWVSRFQRRKAEEKGEAEQ